MCMEKTPVKAQRHVLGNPSVVVAESRRKQWSLLAELTRARVRAKSLWCCSTREWPGESSSDLIYISHEHPFVPIQYL